MFVRIHCITAKTIETVPGHYTSWRADLAPVPAEPGQGMQVSSLGMGREGRKKKTKLLAFVIITLPLVILVLGKHSF